VPAVAELSSYDRCELSNGKLVVAGVEVSYAIAITVGRSRVGSAGHR
jgi:hypothetical protein